MGASNAISARAILKQLVAIESLSGEEEEAANALSELVATSGLEVNRIDNNVWFSIGEGEDVLLLNSHLDVVPASEQHPYPPFEPTVKDGWLYGRGAVDAKGSVAAMVAAICSLRAEGWAPENGQLVGAFTACEESGWPYNGLEASRPHLPAPSAAIVGEPTDLEPCIAQKGLLILRLEARGKSAHAARPDLGDNAAVKAARDILRLDEHGPDRVHPVLGKVTVTPTVVQAGKVRNVIPDLCTVYVDIRSTPAYSHQELVEEIRALVESDVAIHSDRLIPVDTAPDQRIVQAAVAASGGTPFGSPTVSDWIFLSDVPTVKMGPGSSNLSHTPDERIHLDELDKAVQVYRNTILQYFGR
ncbi:MAG: M20/M25/M40 family metallo-hydrolase [Rhodothermales bacterium]|nr:M20/M25/M40 family metallo-hydrolase [Rhodothermales bacterium]